MRRECSLTIDLDDARHVAFARQFGELDDVTPYTKMGKKHRLDFEELFDVSNLLEDGSVAPLDSHRAAMNKVSTVRLFPKSGLKPVRATLCFTWTAHSIHGEQATAF